MALPRRSMPSISGLIAFEATTRHLSFSQAATDLSLTQGAVSKRVDRLEVVLGVHSIFQTAGQQILRRVFLISLDAVTCSAFSCKLICGESPFSADL